jgi:hypothetical protein
VQIRTDHKDCTFAPCEITSIIFHFIFHAKSSSDRLDEKDVASLQVDDDVTLPGNQTEPNDEISNSQSNKTHVEEEDEIDIEDFDSD